MLGRAGYNYGLTCRYILQALLFRTTNYDICRLRRYSRNILQRTENDTKSKKRTTGDYYCLKLCVKQILSLLFSLPWNEFLAKYDQYSLKQWLYQNANVSQSSIGATGIYNNLEPFLDLGLVEVLNDECVYGTTQNQFDFVLNGFDQIPKGFLPHLKDEINYRAKVTGINQSEDGVAVK